jgi:ubiquinone biosynthesis monooxygenase Coq7
MRINHTGEICAQALYAGHSPSGQGSSLNQWLAQSQMEEYAHLQWCQQRLYELGAQPSRLDPVFYLASYSLAKTLSFLSQSYNLRFIRETERQVQAHLEAQIPILTHDPYSCQIIQQMIIEEKNHHDEAHNREPAPMPQIFQVIMQRLSWIMKAAVKYL